VVCREDVFINESLEASSGILSITAVPNRLRKLTRSGNTRVDEPLTPSSVRTISDQRVCREF
jgi:hypothetical protein